MMTSVGNASGRFHVGKIVGLANPMLARDFRQYYSVSADGALRVQQEARISEHNGCTVRCHSRTNRSRRREAPRPCWFISGVCVCGSKCFNSTSRYAQLQEYSAIEFALRRGIVDFVRLTAANHRFDGTAVTCCKGESS